MKTNSKSIGNNFERETAKTLSLWLTKGESDDVLWRDLSSGARATTRKKQNKTTINDGDLVVTDLKYKWFTDCFFIDTKSYKECNFYFTNSKNIKSNVILNQWIKVCGDCPKNKIPMMICNIRDRKSTQFVVLPSMFRFIGLNILKLNLITVSFSEELGYNNNDFVIIEFDNFINNMDAESLCGVNTKNKEK